jgi:TatD DNase family protein
MLHRARETGVTIAVGVGIDLESSRRTVEIARAEPGVVAAVGFHPSHLIGPLTSEDVAALSSLLADPAVRMLGEVGLDAVEFRTSLVVQEEALAALLDLARRRRRAVNLHVRGAHARLFDLLRDAGTAEDGAVLHYFVGDWDLAKRALDEGLYLSVGKPIARAENAELRDAICRTPLHRILLETDTYPLPGRTTEPADVVGVARAAAELKGLSLEEVAATTTATLRGLLR